jgi:hypothetical protein
MAVAAASWQLDRAEANDNLPPFVTLGNDGLSLQIGRKASSARQALGAAVQYALRRVAE